jgi:hypothetical protein
MTLGVALSAVLTLVVAVVILYLVIIYLSLLTSFGGPDDFQASLVDWVMRLGPSVAVFGVVFTFARRTGQGTVLSWVVTTGVLSVPIALLAVMVVPRPAVILPLLVSVALWTVATALGARAGLKRQPPA